MESIDLEDPLDRAMRHREIGHERHKPEEFGFLTSNRGDLGLSSYHSHEVPFGTFQ